MGGDQYRDAIGGKFVYLIPEVASGLRVDTGSGFIEKQQSGLVQHACGKCHALFPATGEPPCKLVLATLQAQMFEGTIDPFAQTIHAIDLADETEVLADREIFIEAESLRHVADFTLDQCRFSADIVSQGVAFAAVCGEESAHHADGGGLAAAIRPQKAEHLAAPNLHRQTIHYGLAGVALGQVAHIDGIFGLAVHCPLPARRISTGCPGTSVAGLSGKASTRKTRRARFPWL